MSITLNGGTGIATDIDGDESLTLNRDTSNGDIIVLQKDNSTIGHIGVEAGDNFYIADEAGNCGINFKGFINPVGSNGETRSNAIDLGNSAGTFRSVYLGTGVYVGGTGDANLLDDYEEGTFTPSFTSDGGTDPTMAYYSRNGRYVKVGKLVTVIVDIVTESRSGGSDYLNISGLPFTANSYATRNGAAIGFNWNWNNGAPKNAYVNHNDTNIKLFRDASSNTKTNVTDIVSSGNSYISLSMSYLAT